LFLEYFLVMLAMICPHQMRKSEIIVEYLTLRFFFFIIQYIYI